MIRPSRNFALALSFAAATLLVSALTLAQDAKAPAMSNPPRGARVRILSPENGAKLTNPVKLRFSASRIKTEPAGVALAGSGHHHVIVDALPPALGEVIPTDAQHLHFGKAQKEAEIQLPPGLHTLTLQFADGLHRSYGPQMRDTIIIEVQK